MAVVQAPPREQVPVLDVWGAQVGTRPESLDHWILRARTEVWMREPKPLELVLAMDIPTNRELLREVDFRYVDLLTGPHPKMFGMDIVVDPAVTGFEIRYTTMAEWAEERARQLRNERRGLTS